jgi:hypothetical protein
MVEVLLTVLGYRLDEKGEYLPGPIDISGLTYSTNVD